MRKVKLEVAFKVPSWNFCTYDGFTDNGRFSKDVCKFCVKTKGGHRCTLFDEDLAADSKFVHKSQRCIKLTAGFAQQSTPEPLAVDPKIVMRETLKQYKDTVKQLLSQGYPKEMAETIAERFVMGGDI